MSTSEQNQIQLPIIHPFGSITKCSKCNSNIETAKINYFTSNRNKNLVGWNFNGNQVLKHNLPSEFLTYTCCSCSYQWFEHTADYQPTTALTLEEMTAKGIKWPLDIVVSAMPLSKDLNCLLSMTTIITLADLLNATLEQIEAQIKGFGYKELNKELVSKEIQEIVKKSGY